MQRSKEDFLRALLVREKIRDGSEVVLTEPVDSAGGLVGKDPPSSDNVLLSVEVPTTKELVKRVEAVPAAQEALHALLPLIPQAAEARLKDIYYFAILGVSQGFSERGLSPFLPEHLEMIPALMADIQAVFLEVQASAAQVTDEEFCRQAYEFGLHKAFYLDWRLYMSHEMY